jgi:carbonic anhydrase
VRAAVDKKELGLVSNWLRHLEDIRDKFSGPLGKLKTSQARADKLCELNVLEQVRNVCESTIVQNAWKSRQALAVHGWVYGLDDGRLRDLMKKPITSAKEIL